MDNQISQIKSKIVPILKSAGVTKSAIFGSFARGENTEKSDLDLLVDFSEGISLFDFAGLQIDLENALQKKVDLVDYETIKPRLKSYILSNNISVL